MQYLIYINNQEAKYRSFNIATEQGCSDDPTAYWFNVINHPTNGEAAMCIGEGEEDKLTIEEQSKLVSKEYMDINGWFSSSIPIIN